MKTTVTDRVYDSTEAEYEIRNLKRAGYTRVSNAYWVETWQKGDNTVILIRDF